MREKNSSSKQSVFAIIDSSNLTHLWFESASDLTEE